MAPSDADQVVHVDLRARVHELFARGAVQGERDDRQPAVDFLRAVRYVALAIDRVRQEARVIHLVVITEALPLARVRPAITEMHDAGALAPARARATH